MIGFFYDSYRLVLSFFLLGVFLGAVYDVFRVLRIGRSERIAVTGRFYELIRPKKRLFGRGILTLGEKAREKAGNVLLFFEDILFFLIASVAMILCFFHTNDGEIRIICLLSAVLGFFVYHISVGRLVVFFARQIVYILKCAVYWMLYGLIVPMRLLFGVMKLAAGKLYDATVGRAICAICRRRRAAYSEKRKKELLQLAAMGFGVGREGEV